MSNGVFRIPTPHNEVVLSYAPGTPERRAFAARVKEMSSEVIEIPAIIGGQEVYTGKIAEVTSPHNHRHVLARVHVAGAPEVEKAVAASREAARQWADMPWEHRAAIFLKAADLLAGPWRMTLNAATLLGQSKTCHQAEIDSACELIDFLRFNVHFAQQIYQMQPESSPGMWNRTDVRPLEGFVLAVTPFNFTAIGGNLPTSPALMGNVVLWKPAMTSLLSNYYFMRLLMEAGLPPGVINFIPSPGAAVGGVVLPQPDLAGLHFTGSTGTFNTMWATVGNNLSRYKGYPRLVGETGGKDFIFAHPSADVAALSVAIVRGSFEYQGQKCSAASRLYIPSSIWPEVEARVKAMVAEIKVGDPADFTTYMGAVIDQKSFAKITGHLEKTRGDSTIETVCGNRWSSDVGWFIEPTLLRTSTPHHELMSEELFGPVVTAYVYDDARFEETLKICDSTGPYALTGAFFAQDRAAIVQAERELRFAAGNFYLNDKPTGAVVGQQPFGGARGSGTNDKAGSLLNLLRWVSPRTIKETFVPPTDWRYSFLSDKE